MRGEREAIAYLRKNDEVISNIMDEIGKCKISPSKNYFLSLVKSIIYQQISVKAGKTIYDRFVVKLDKKITPETILGLTDDEFRSAGISRQKMSYLRDLSLKFKEGIIKPQFIIKMSDEEIINNLTKIKGIGRWSAEMFLIFSLNRPNVFPMDDVGLKKAIKINYNLKNTPQEKDMIKISKKWGGYKTFAVWYLWQSINKND